MKEQILVDIKEGTLQARVHHASGVIHVSLVGSADMRSRETLDSIFTQLHADALRLAVSSVVVNLTSLSFMNSSCMKSFVRWLSSVQGLDARSQYKIRFLSRPELLWQRRSLHALRCFALDLVTVES